MVKPLISVSMEVKEELNKLKNPGMTYDDVIKTLLSRCGVEVKTPIKEVEKSPNPDSISDNNIGSV